MLTYCLACFARYVDPACGDVDKSILSYRAPTTVRGRTVTFADGGTFDADIIYDIIYDISAHQNLCQVCRGEGDIVLSARRAPTSRAALARKTRW